jgi:hypothetical protein
MSLTLYTPVPLEDPSLDPDSAMDVNRLESPTSPGNKPSLDELPLSVDDQDSEQKTRLSRLRSTYEATFHHTSVQSRVAHY